MERITTPEQLVAAATWEPIQKYTDKQRTTTMQKPAWTIVWTWEVLEALPRDNSVGLVNASNATDVMARAVRTAHPMASEAECKLYLARRIMGLRTAIRTPAVDPQRAYADAMAAAVDAGVPADVAEKIVRSSLAAAGIVVPNA